MLAVIVDEERLFPGFDPRAFGRFLAAGQATP
jgi:hypothetical protein